MWFPPLGDTRQTTTNEHPYLKMEVWSVVCHDIGANLSVRDIVPQFLEEPGNLSLDAELSLPLIPLRSDGCERPCLEPVGGGFVTPSKLILLSITKKCDLEKRI